MTRVDFNDYVKQFSRKLYGYSFRILQNQEEAEDAVQEVFIKLWKMRDKLDQYKSIEALATTMTKNYCIDQIRKQKNISLREDSEWEFNSVSTPSPHEEMEISESNDILYNIIDHLPQEYKVMIRLRDIDGMSYKEISDKTNQNINTLRVILSRARKLIREEYNKFHYEER
jgi:RNA polymerase sigma-70 factor, ECF subfamily